jgi:LAO/AO transport system kinase
MSRPLLPVEAYVEGIRAGNRVVLGQAITLIESRRPEHQARAQEVLAALGPGRPDSLRVGITGAPGVGKSTLIEALGMYLIGQGRRVAVLAVDPTSAVSKGSILGDKTRMEQLSASEHAFIRPSPSGESLGGVARKTRETIALVEAAGFDTVLVETVGVGQSEIAVHGMTDLFLLLLLPGAGDELQGIKRGIVEMADLLAVTKADGDRLALANQARAHYLNAVRLLPPKPGGWTPRVVTCSAVENKGITELWEVVTAYRRQTEASGFFAENRRRQALHWFNEALRQGLEAAFYGHRAVQAALQSRQAAVLNGEVSPFVAAEEVLKEFLKLRS